METEYKNGKRGFGLVAGIIGSVGYLIFSILTSGLSEALRYFGVTIVLFILLFAYIEIEVKPKVKFYGQV